ncbi:DUF262 domain-containing protein [Luteolibacter sp. Populi]|uniref:DUF262 domain-containing protein n=1 Tax=Luteolibacter sp. Populi TaxID=3230487 RepID=UPI00346585CC
MEASSAMSPAILPEKGILSVERLLSDRELKIPGYQRPYKWTEKNVLQLFSDIALHQKRPSYRLGTVVFHREEGTRNIVDGQQRIITLMLAVLALIETRRDKIMRNDLKERLDALAATMAAHHFSSEISRLNIHRNYRTISRMVASEKEFSEDLIDFFLERCQVVIFTLNDISEAFQFFDSQNARGKDLDPHDLLKAYHLREFEKADEALKAQTVAKWESTTAKDLSKLFSDYLFRIRNWSRDRPTGQFGKDDIGLFKGVNIDRTAPYPYVRQLRIAHHFVDHYNGQYERRIDGRGHAFPFQIDQTIVNGRRFFEMTEHYLEKVAVITAESKNGDKSGLTELATRILETINDYPGMHRKGDGYVRAIFDCLLVYYLDKFGTVEISAAIGKIFIWAYGLRLKLYSVRPESMDKHVLGTGNLFVVLRDAFRPEDFIRCHLPVLREARKKTEGIEDLFREMKYL